MNAHVGAAPDPVDDTEAIARKSIGRKALLRMALLALAMVGGAGYASHWWSHGRFIEDTDDAYVGADVTVISAKVPGYITEVAVVDNQFVKAGDLGADRCARLHGGTGQSGWGRRRATCPSCKPRCGRAVAACAHQSGQSADRRPQRRSSASHERQGPLPDAGQQPGGFRAKRPTRRGH